MAGKVLVDGGTENFLLILGSLVIILGGLLMLVMFAMHGRTGLSFSPSRAWTCPS